MASAGSITVAAIGVLVLVLTLVDLFVTIFNYDGFTFLAGRMHRYSWRALRGTSRLLPHRARRGYLSLGSAAMLPMTLAWWLALEITAFALIYLPGLADGAFARNHLQPGIGSAFYLSGGAISSLTFGDAVPTSGLYRALVDLQTIVGLATFTLALTYVLAAFDALGTLTALHGRVRRHAVAPNRPASILARYYHGGQPNELSGLLASLTEDLDAYDQGLRRYPVVFYFHARRTDRSIPVIFGALGDLVELLRWGLPAGEALTREPYLLALADEYTVTVERLRRSFVGPDEAQAPEPLPAEEFARAYATRGYDDYVDAYRQVQQTAAEAAGLTESDERRYERYREWLPFHYRRRVFLARVREELGYPPGVGTDSAAGGTMGAHAAPVAQRQRQTP
jgi:hypothetical protein